MMEINDHTNFGVSFDMIFVDCWMQLFKEKKIKSVEEKNDEE